MGKWKLGQATPFTDGTINVVEHNGVNWTRICIVGPGPAEWVMATGREIVDAHNRMVRDQESADRLYAGSRK